MAENYALEAGIADANPTSSFFCLISDAFKQSGSANTL